MDFFSSRSAAENPLLIRVLEWASKQGSGGFKLSELKDATACSEDDWIWVERMMLGEIYGISPLIAHLGDRHKEGEYRYFITTAGESALVDYFGLKEARKSAQSATKWAALALGLSFLALLVGAVSAWYEIDSNRLTDRGLAMATEPRIEIYIQRMNADDEENFILGIENSGTNDVKNVRIESGVIQMEKKSYAQNKENMFYVGQSPLQIPVLQAGATSSDRIYIENKDVEWVEILFVSLSYEREIDKRKFSKQYVFIFDKLSILSLDQAKSAADLKPVVDAFLQYTADNWYLATIYGEEI